MLLWTVTWNVPSWDTQERSTPHWPMSLLSQIAFLASTTDGEVQCPSSDLAGRRRQ